MNRAVPIVLLVLGTLLSAGSAWAVNAWIASTVAPEASDVPVDAPTVASSSPTARTTTRSRPRALTGAQYLDGIMRRNLFDENIIATWNPNPDKPDAMSRSELKVKLLGTVVAEPESFSSALIADEGNPYPKGYSIGDKLYDREVIKIEKKRVTLKRPDGEIEVLSIDEEMSAGPREPSSPKPTGGDDKGVEQTDDDRYQVNKELFDKYINDLESISRMGRALLHRGPDGEFDGYRLSAIRRNTLADQLGIKNGDIIHSVNGQALDSVQSAMGAYNTLKSESSFCFEITRRGSPQELCYDVR